MSPRTHSPTGPQRLPYVGRSCSGCGPWGPAAGAPGFLQTPQTLPSLPEARRLPTKFLPGAPPGAGQTPATDRSQRGRRRERQPVRLCPQQEARRSRGQAQVAPLRWPRRPWRGSGGQPRAVRALGQARPPLPLRACLPAPPRSSSPPGPGGAPGLTFHRCDHKIHHLSRGAESAGRADGPTPEPPLPPPPEPQQQLQQLPARREPSRAIRGSM